MWCGLTTTAVFRQLVPLITHIQRHPHPRSHPMITTLHIRPLPTHPLTLPATMEIRATQDILGTASFGRVFDDPTPHMLNHPPVILINADGGEVLLNRDTVVSQLQSNRVPNSLVVYALKATTLNVSLRTLHFLYGQLQPLHYQKRDANGNRL